MIISIVLIIACAVVMISFDRSLSRTVSADVAALHERLRQLEERIDK